MFASLSNRKDSQVMRKYFADNLTKEQLDRQYKMLCKSLHPDAGGDQQEFILMSNEYKNRLLQLQETAKSTHNYELYEECAVSLNSILGIISPKTQQVYQRALNSHLGEALIEFLPPQWQNVVKKFGTKSNNKGNG